VPEIKKGSIDLVQEGRGAVRVTRGRWVRHPPALGQSELGSAAAERKRGANPCRSGVDPGQRLREEHASQERGKTLN